MTLPVLLQACAGRCGAFPESWVEDTFSVPEGTPGEAVDAAVTLLGRRAVQAGACAVVERDGGRIRARLWSVPPAWSSAEWTAPNRLTFAPATEVVDDTPAQAGEENWPQPSTGARWRVRPAAGMDHVGVRSAEVQAGDGGAFVAMELDDPGRQAFAALTLAHLHETVVIALDGVVLLAPRIQEPITGGRVHVTCDRATCDVLAARLSGGALPVALTWESEAVVGPAP